MGKKSSSSQPSSVGPLSPTSEIPRMEPPPPYESVSRSSTSSSVRSTDRLDPDRVAADNQQPPQRTNDNTAASAAAPTQEANDRGRKPQYPQADGGCLTRGKDAQGCMNYGERSNGCMNYGNDTNGCMNYGDGSDGCMNYDSKEGCMNYRSTGGCMNYEVSDDWHGNEGCMNYRRGGGCMLWGN